MLDACMNIIYTYICAASYIGMMEMLAARHHISMPCCPAGSPMISHSTFTITFLLEGGETTDLRVQARAGGHTVEVGDWGIISPSWLVIFYVRVWVPSSSDEPGITFVASHPLIQAGVDPGGKQQIRYCTSTSTRARFGTVPFSTKYSYEYSTSVRLPGYSTVQVLYEFCTRTSNRILMMPPGRPARAPRCPPPGLARVLPAGRPGHPWPAWAIPSSTNRPTADSQV